jgi:hypothetical protein
MKLEVRKLALQQPKTPAKLPGLTLFEKNFVISQIKNHCAQKFV